MTFAGILIGIVGGSAVMLAMGVKPVAVVIGSLVTFVVMSLAVLLLKRS